MPAFAQGVLAGAIARASFSSELVMPNPKRLRAGIRSNVLPALIVICFASLVDSDAMAARNARAVAADAAFLDRYCTECHDQEDWKGGLALDLVDLADISGEAELWEKVVRKVRTGMMPPAGEPRPAAAQSGAFATRIENELDRAAQAHPRPGTPSLRRLTRFEYANAVRDLLALDVNIATLLPPDNNSDGFDTNGDTLANSPALIEAYVAAASKLSRRAIGDRHASAVQVDYRPPPGWSQDRHIDGLPLGTRGGFAIRHEFPLDGEYEFSIAIASGVPLTRGLPRGAELFVTIDGTPVREPDLQKFRYRVAAGARAVAVTLFDKARYKATDDIYSIDRLLGVVGGVTIVGPFNADGPGDTASRRRIFVCQPTSPATEEICARRILARLATRAYRRPIGAQDAAVDALMSSYRAARMEGNFDDGIEQALARVLVNPHFLFRLEREPTGLEPGSIYRVSDLELASRLSFFLWSSIPDEELLAVAADGSLHQPRILEKQVLRMLGDARAKALVDNFAAQWLKLRALNSIPVEGSALDENLKQSLRKETEHLLTSMLRENRSILDLINADYTFVDEGLARHYGLAGIRGSHMRRIALDEHDPRRGLLGQGSILALTSMVDRTSPVIRGKWIMETLLGAPVPAPPPGVETNLEPQQGEHGQPMTLRQRLEAHRVQANCAACHRIMDPIGFALENFDNTGRWRTMDGGAAIDAKGVLTDGTPLDGPASLREWLIAHPEVFATNFTEKLLIYGLGRSIDHRDMPTVRSIVREAAKADYRLSALILSVVRSQPFQSRTMAAAASPHESESAIAAQP
jgi:hypothetical protein